MIPGVYIEMLHAPQRYTTQQIELACIVASLLNRGCLLLLEEPRR